MTGSPPLQMQLVSESRTTAEAVTALTVRVTNHGDAALTPHFTLTTGQGMGRYWSIKSGPATLDGHASARYELLPPSGTFTVPRAGVRMRLRAVSAAPMTLSSTDLHLKAAASTR